MPHPVVDPQVVLVLDGGTSEGQLKLGKKIPHYLGTLKRKVSFENYLLSSLHHCAETPSPPKTKSTLFLGVRWDKKL